MDNRTIRKKTLDSYCKHVDEYTTKKNTLGIERTNSYWLGVEYFLSQLTPKQTIFEIGSGTGYDAGKIENEGFIVNRSDVVDVFLAKHSEDGYTTEFYDVLDGPRKRKESAIYVNAVLLHFNLELFRLALANIYNSLCADGYLCIGMKLGDFEGWREKGLSGVRYFKFWDLKNLQSELSLAGFNILNTSISSDKSFALITAQAIEK